MAVPHRADNFPDLLDPRFERIWNDEYNQHEDYIPLIYESVPHNGRDRMSFSSVSTLEDFQEFAGTVQYQDQFQGYDATMVYREFVSGFQLERRLWDDDQYQIWDDSPRALAASAFRTRQKHAARIFNNAFSVDTYFYTQSEGLALCSNSHTTTTDASTAEGFDNVITAELTAVGVNTAWTQMVQFRGSQAEIIQVNPDELWYPVQLREQADEILKSQGKLDTANNNINAYQGAFTGRAWNYLTDANNWFMCDSAFRRLMVKWVDRIPLEYGFVEDFDTYTAKYRAYMRYANIWRDWRWICGSLVS